MEFHDKAAFKFLLIFRLRYHEEITENVRVTSKLSAVNFECDIPSDQDYISILKPEIIRAQ